MHLRYAGVIALLVVAGAACGSSSSKANSASPTTISSVTSAAAPTTVAAPSTTAGGTSGTPVKLAQVGDDMLVVNGKGFTVYAFAPDTATTSSCASGCDTVWPPVTVTGAVPATMNGLTLTTITRSDGTKQAVVNGHPVYTFSGDTKVGDKNGEGVAGKWYYVNAQGEPDKG